MSKLNDASMQSAKIMIVDDALKNTQLIGSILSREVAILVTSVTVVRKH